MNTLKININRIAELVVIFKKIGNCYCVLSFFVGYILLSVLHTADYPLFVK